MNTLLNKEKLEQFSKKYSEEFKEKKPYPYIAIDNFFDNDKLEEILKVFPTPKDLDFYKYDNPLEKKLAMDQISKLPDQIRNLLIEMNLPIFLNFLENLTGINNLIPDPYYRGGGVHQSERNGKLDIHIDFNIHPKLKLYRRLNAIIYLNKDWKEQYDGAFQIWSGEKTENGHKLSRMHDMIYPVFNRFVVFATSEKSYHGFPDPIQCPDNMTRKSLALYYYTSSNDNNETNESHSTVFVKRPWEDDSLDELRNIRNKGRLSTNVTDGVKSV